MEVWLTPNIVSVLMTMQISDPPVHLPLLPMESFKVHWSTPSPSAHSFLRWLCPRRIRRLSIPFPSWTSSNLFFELNLLHLSHSSFGYLPSLKYYHHIRFLTIAFLTGSYNLFVIYLLIPYGYAFCRYMVELPMLISWYGGPCLASNSPLLLLAAWDWNWTGGQDLYSIPHA